MTEYRDETKRSDLIKILRVFWKRKWLIIYGTGIITLVGLIITLLLPKTYISKAIVTVSTIKKADQEEPPTGMEIPVYIRFADIYQSENLFKKYLAKNENKENWEFDDDFFDSHFHPIYAYEYGRPGVKITDNSILGVKIIATGDSPESVFRKAKIMADYIITTLLNMQIGHFFDSISIRAQTGIAQLEKNVIDLKIEIRHFKEKESLIEKQLMNIPGIGKKTDRELVNASEATEKYLSPQQQLVAVKVSIKDNEILIDRTLRKIQINKFLLQYLEKTALMFNGNKEYLVNDRLLSSLMEERKTLFADKTDEESKLASITLSEKFFYFQKLQNTIYKIISGPTLPEKHYKPKRKRIVIGLFFLSFFCFIFLALIVEQWERSKG